MKNEAVDALECKSGKIYVDCTLGGGGHSGLILSRIQPDGKLIAFDVDEDAINAASERLKDYNNLTIVKNSYTNIKKVLHNLGIEKLRAVYCLISAHHITSSTKAKEVFHSRKKPPLI